MRREKLKGWIEGDVFKELELHAKFDRDECVVEAIEGFGPSVLVSLSSLGGKPISVTMDGEEVLTEVVLFSLERDSEPCEVLA